MLIEVCYLRKTILFHEMLLLGSDLLIPVSDAGTLCVCVCVCVCNFCNFSDGRYFWHEAGLSIVCAVDNFIAGFPLFMIWFLHMH